MCHVIGLFLRFPGLSGFGVQLSPHLPWPEDGLLYLLFSFNGLSYSNLKVLVVPDIPPDPMKRGGCRSFGYSPARGVLLLVIYKPLVY